MSNRIHLQDPVAIFWDYENCAPQTNSSCYDTVHKFRDIALKFGTVKLIKAYLRLSDHSSGKGNNLRSDLQACGVSLTDCPHNGRKDIADKMMLVDMIQFGWDNPAPATVILISGDRDFAYGVSVLRLRHYRVVIMAQSSLIHHSLRCQASEFYDWDAVVLSKQNPIGRSVDFGHLPSQMLTNTRVHSRSSVQAISSVAARTSSPNPEPHDNRQSDAPSPSSLAATTSHLSLSTGSSRTAGVTPVHSRESSTPEQYAERRSAQGRDPWGSSGSSISPSTFVTALTPSDLVKPLRSASNTGILSHEHAVYTEEPCETSVEAVRFQIIPRVDHVEDMRPGRESAQRTPSSLPIPTKTRPTDSPVQRPATAGPVMMSIRNGAPSTDEPSESGDLEMSVQTLPENPTARPRVSLAPVVHTLPHTGPRAVPLRFLPLVQVLDRLREAGTHRPLRSHVAIALTKIDPRVYDNAGVSRFKQYSDLAMQEGFVELGGAEGQAWITLLPHWHGLGSSELQ